MTKPIRNILVTSALPYANGHIHLGHLVEYIQTDIWVRFQKQQGHNCRYMCADDSHGTPIMLSAKKQGITPEDLIARMFEEHIKDFASFFVEFDNYYTTHSEENQKLAEFIYNSAKAKGTIYEKEIEQSFCPKCNIFLPDRLIKGTCPFCKAEDQYGDSCEKCSATYSPADLIAAKCAECGTMPILKKSKHFFFKLSAFAQDLKTWVNADHVSAQTQHKLLEWFEQGLKDWDITRDAPYFGFKIPETEDKYFYVWLDAPIGYIATTQNWCEKTGQKFEDIWQKGDWEIHHFIGKDILYFHTLFWPAILMVAGFKTPNKVNIHGFLTINNQKMSKSRGTFIQARDYLKILPPEFLRYYYAAKLSATAEDLDLNLEDFALRINSDVVNKFINITSRIGKIVNNKFESQISIPEAEGETLLTKIRSSVPQILKHYETLEYAKAIKEIMAFADATNKYIDDLAPWEVLKTNPEKARQICTAALNAARILAALLKPVIPQIVQNLEKFLNCEPLNFENLNSNIANQKINLYEHLARRIDLKAITQIIKI